MLVWCFFTWVGVRVGVNACSDYQGYGYGQGAPARMRVSHRTHGSDEGLTPTPTLISSCRWHAFPNTLSTPQAGCNQCGVYVCHYWSAPLMWTSAVFHWWSISQNTVQLRQHSGCWDLDGNSIHAFLPIRLLGTITRGVLRLYIQLEAILDSVPAAITAGAG